MEMQDIGQFEDIKIKELDDNASGPDHGAFMRMVLKLSDSAPEAWSSMFNQAWTNHMYMAKRGASASGSSITVVCIPNELQGQINEMKGVIAKVNAAYKETQAAAHARRKAVREQAEREQQALKDLKGKLTFD